MNSTIEISPQDAAMESFRQAFRFPLCRCHVVKNGNLMRFRLSSDRLATIYWLASQTVIQQEGLPLTAEIDEWAVSGCVFDRWLVLKFDSAKLVPENY
jgi:hypothetical protein